MTALATLEPCPQTHIESIPLRMAQLAMRGLSEAWWLRHLGDVHWQLIAESFGQHTTVFRDSKNRQMYAAFCATEFDQTQPDLARLGQTLDLRSELWAAGKSRIQSNHTLSIAGTGIARFRLVSTFVVHEQAGLNASVTRATPYVAPVLPNAPDDFAGKATALAKAQRVRTSLPSRRDKIELFPSVGGDFNAVGLLYFPSYTRLFDDLHDRKYQARPWSPVRHRLITYFSNIEPGDRLTGTIDSTKDRDCNALQSVLFTATSTKIAACELVRHVVPAKSVEIVV